MKVFFAGVESLYEKNLNLVKDGYNLISYYSINKKVPEIIHNSRALLLDSGAYTFMRNNNNIEWENYIDNYGNFINEYSVEHFFELDIDSIVGYDKVLYLRNRLERKTNRKVIPVWHKSRGIKDFLNICNCYDYVAIGGIASGEINKAKYELFPRLINYAHSCNVKIHCLGFTDTKKLHSYHFDSVDSTSWGWGRYGYRFIFTGSDMRMLKKPEGKRCSMIQELQANNIKEWIKFQQYAEVNL